MANELRCFRTSTLFLFYEYKFLWNTNSEGSIFPNPSRAYPGKDPLHPFEIYKKVLHREV